MPAWGCARCLRRPRWPSWRPGSVETRAGGTRWWRCRARSGCRCRLPSPGCGSSSSCRGRPRFTTWRWRCGWVVGWMPARWGRRWPMWWAARRVCARCSRRLRGSPSSRWCRLSGPTSAGTSLMPAAGRPTGWPRPSARPRVARSIWPLRCRCGRGCSASPTMSTCWWRWCTISPPTAGRSPRWWVIWGWPMPAGAPGRRRAGRRCRCSMPITRCGSGRSWVSSRTATARSPRSWPTGSRPWPGCPSGWCCPPIGPIRRWPITGAPVDWPAEFQQQVARVAREHNATSFMVVQAALAVLLAKLSASAEVAVGFPIAGRRDPALDELVGFFVNTLVLRVEVAGDPRVAELLAQVRGRALAAYEHQDVPFEILVDRLNPTRSLAHHPLVQVMLAWQNLPGQDNDAAAGLALGDVEVTPLPADTHTARMDLVFSLAERWSQAGEPAGIGGTVEFRTDVFDAASIEALIERFRRVLAAITTDPTRPLSSIDLLDADEHARLDAIGNRAVLTAPVSPPVSVPVLVAAQVARTPAAVAISCEGRSLTYRELEEAANRLAHLLAAQGAGPGQCVALLLERSAQAVVAMLAVLKTGAAYLAIDPALPDARMQFMLNDAAPTAAITAASLRSRLDGCEVAVIEVDDPAIATQPDTALPAPAP